jgi:hypothetical protein
MSKTEKYKTNIDLSQIEIKDIPAKLANDLICKNHYSKTVAQGVQFHIGIFYENTLYGVAQFGYGIRPKDTCKWVRGTKPNEYLELNRLWISDKLGMNSESKCISMCLKWIKRRKPETKWIISFADGMMGKVGIIYQATNFVYTGFRKDGGIWMTKGGERLHSVSLWHKHGTINRGVLEGIYGTPLYKIFGGQYRYFWFYDKKCIKDLIVPVLPYPKQTDLKNHLDIKTKYKDDGDNWDSFTQLLSKSFKKSEIEQNNTLNKFFTYKREKR